MQSTTETRIIHAQPVTLQTYSVERQLTEVERNELFNQRSIAQLTKFLQVAGFLGVVWLVKAILFPAPVLQAPPQPTTFYHSVPVPTSQPQQNSCVGVVNICK